MSEDYDSSGGGDEGGGGRDGDSYSETSKQSWFQRLGKAFGGVVLGLILVPVALIVLWWNEGRAVDTAQALAEAGQNVVTIDSAKVDPANDGKLAHATGNVATEETLSDDKLGVKAKGMIRLSRESQMYAWKETMEEKSERQVGGAAKSKKTYTYNREWLKKDQFKDSSSFKDSEGHQNPPWTDDMAPMQFFAQKVTLGAFLLSANLIKQIPGNDPFPVKEEDIKQLPEDLQEKTKIVSGAFYISSKKGSEADPKVGDFKINYTVAKPQQVSVMAEQSQGGFRAYQPKSASKTLEMLSPGNKSAKEMVTEAEAENTTLTWILRAVGFIVVVIGIFMLFNPLVILADFIPILGDFTGCMLSIFAFFAGIALSLITIALAWIAYRPLLAYPILAVAALGIVGVVGMLVYSMMKKSVPKETGPSKKK